MLRASVFGASRRQDEPQHADRRQMIVSTAPHRPLPFINLTAYAMKNDQILIQISEFCRPVEMAESNLGRRAVYDGKLVHRLREGQRITIDTLDRIQAFITGSMPDGVLAAARLRFRQSAGVQNCPL